MDNKERNEPGFVNAKERLYDKVPFTVKQMDFILAALAVLFVVLFIFGALKGNHII